MNRLLALLGTGLIGSGIAACGDTSESANQASRIPPGAVATGGARTTSTTAAEGKRDRDKDRDNPTNSYYDEDDSVILRFGRAASAAEEQTISSLVRQYFVAAAAADGATACQLIYPVLAEAIPGIDGRSPTSPALHGNTCAVVVSKIFKQIQPILADDLAKLKVTSTRIEGNRGFALLNFGPSKPAGVIRIHRESRTWMIGEPLPSVLL